AGRGGELARRLVIIIGPRLAVQAAETVPGVFDRGRQVGGQCRVVADSLITADRIEQGFECAIEGSVPGFGGLVALTIPRALLRRLAKVAVKADPAPGLVDPAGAPARGACQRAGGLGAGLDFG